MVATFSSSAFMQSTNTCPATATAGSSQKCCDEIGHEAGRGGMCRIVSSYCRRRDNTVSMHAQITAICGAVRTTIVPDYWTCNLLYRMSGAST